jgi:hypothetical protein
MTKLRPEATLTPRSAVAVLAGLVAVVATLVGCSEPTATAPQNPSSTRFAASFPSALVFDYQLGGGYEPADGVGGVARDSTDSADPDRYSICYVNGFQSQPADRESWLAEPNLVLLGDDGAPIIDENWPDELILDTSSDELRARIAARIGESIADCAEAGFDAVEIDNLDSYTRSNDRLTEDDAIALATRYAVMAHAAGLLIGQKNASELGTRGRDEVGFDFAVAEECHRYDECEKYTDVYGDAVIDIEYVDGLRGSFAEVCKDPGVPFSTILRDRDLVSTSDPGHVFEACAL